MKCRECYRKNFYLVRDMMKVYEDADKTIWECPDCRKQSTYKKENFI